LTGDDLRPARQDWSGNLNPTNVFANGKCIVLGERVPRASFQANAAGGLCAGRHQQQVGTQCANFLRDLRLRAQSDRNHADHRCHPDDDPQDSQNAPHLIDAERAQRGTQAKPDIHDATSEDANVATPSLGSS
jgi:hypothetical protein